MSITLQSTPPGTESAACRPRPAMAAAGDPGAVRVHRGVRQLHRAVRSTEPIPGAKIFEPPFWSTGGSTRALLGTDFQGRDVVSRLIFGARVSLIVGVMGTVVAGSIGTTLGMLAGYIGGWVDQLIMRVTDAWLALPAIVFAIFLATMVGPSMWNIIIILGAVYWTRYARVIRGEVLSLREREFVKLAEIAGASRTRVIMRHILPDVMNSTMVLASLTIGVVTIAERR